LQALIVACFSGTTNACLPAQLLDQVHKLVLKYPLQRFQAVLTFEAANRDAPVHLPEALKQRANGDLFAAGQLRTLQRRVREWRRAIARRLVLGTNENADVSAAVANSGGGA
jgi:hypothetical protein